MIALKVTDIVRPYMNMKLNLYYQFDYLEECKQIENSRAKGKWSEEEDILLRSIVSQHHTSWVDVARKFPRRNAKQCRDRWLYHLNPNVNKSKFSDDEDQKLLTVYRHIGGKWSKIVKFVGNGRTENMVRSRLQTLLRDEQKFNRVNTSEF